MFQGFRQGRGLHVYHPCRLWIEGTLARQFFGLDGSGFGLFRLGAFGVDRLSKFAKFVQDGLVLGLQFGLGLEGRVQLGLQGRLGLAEDL